MRSPLRFSQPDLHVRSTGWPCSGALPASTTSSLGLSLQHFKEGTKTIPKLYLETAPRPLQAAMTVVKTFLPLLSWLRNPSSVPCHLTIHFAKPNSKPEWLGLMSAIPPGHITRDSRFWPFLPLLAPPCRSRPGFLPHTGLQVTNKTWGPGQEKDTYFIPRPLQQVPR